MKRIFNDNFITFAIPFGNWHNFSYIVENKANQNEN